MGSLDIGGFDPYTGTTTSADSIYTHSITIKGLDYNALGGSLYYDPPKPKTNLDWLNSRVDEMRVKL